MLSYTVILDSGVSRRNFRVSGPIALINPYACILFPNRGVMNILFLNPYSVNNVTVLRLHPASKSANLARPRARTHTRVLPP